MRITPTKGKELLVFLNLLLKAGIIRREDLAHFRSKYDSPDELFESLDSLDVFPNDVLTKIYAEAVGLPYVKLISLDRRAARLIDQATAKKFGFVPFFVDERNRVVQVALTEPYRLHSLDRRAMAELEKKIGYKIELFLAPRPSNELPEVSTQQVTPVAASWHPGQMGPELGQSEPIRSKPAAAPIQSIELGKEKIDEKLLRKMPYDIAMKHRAVIFREPARDTFDVAAENPEARELNDILSFVAKQTGIKFHLYRAAAEQVERVLRDYRKAMADNPPKPLEMPKPPLPVQDAEEAASQNGLKFYAERAVQTRSVKDQDEKVASPEGGEKAEERKLKIQQLAMEEPDLVRLLGKSSVTVEDLKAYVNEEKVPQLVGAIILLAVNNRASDVHVEPFEKSARVRLRIDGELGDVLFFPAALTDSIVARVKILAKLKLDEQRVPQDGRFGVKVGKDEIDIRVASLPTVFGEKVAMRLLSKTKKLDSLNELGLDGMAYDKLTNAMGRPYGVILVTGPTGSGKSTTLYSILSVLNNPGVNIITLEDPVEYQIQGINQVQIRPQIGFGFAEGLRSIVRQDPNIVMVGEIRDSDTAELVTHAALTGHLVLATLHTNNASGAMPRLFNLGVEPFLLTSAINLILAQRLVRKICPNCREEITLSQSVAFAVKKELANLNIDMPIKFFRGRGCDKCRGGYKGRIGIFEVLPVTSQIEQVVLENKPTSAILEEALKEGMITMRQDGLIKALKGITTVKEVLAATSEAKAETSPLRRPASPAGGPGLAQPLSVKSGELASPGGGAERDVEEKKGGKGGQRSSQD